MEVDNLSLKTAETLVPRIYVALPRSGDADVTLSGPATIIERHILGDLIIFYAFDVGTHFELVAQRDIDRLGMTREELHERAMQNLRALRLEVRAAEQSGILQLLAGGDYEATLILLPEVWESVATMIEGRLVVSVPARNVVFATGDADVGNLARLRSRTSETLEHAEKPLSRMFLTWIESGWKEYEGYAG